MKIKSAILAPIFAAAVVFTGSSASANTYRSYLEYTQVGAFATLAGSSNNLTSNTPPYYGLVTLTEGGIGTNAYVDVHVDLYYGLKFVDTGNNSNHVPFGFNLTNPTIASVTQATVPWVTHNPLTTTNNPYGSFNYGLDCCATNGGSAAVPSPLDFRVTSTNGITFFGVGGYYNSPSDYHVGTGDRFMSNFDGLFNGGWWFVADALAPDGATGLIAARDLVVFTPVPEPETYTMLAAGLGLMGFIAARRRRKVSA